MNPKNPEAIKPVDFGAEHQPLQESIAIETSTEVSQFNTDNFDIRLRQFAESQTLQPVEQCLKNKNYDQVEHVVGTVSNTPFKRNYDLSVDKLGLKSAELNTWTESEKFSPETTEWMNQVEAVLWDINRGSSTEELIKRHGEDKVIGSQGAFQFLLAFSRVYDVACNLSGENKVILGISNSKNPASYVVLKKAETPEYNSIYLPAKADVDSVIGQFDKITASNKPQIDNFRKILEDALSKLEEIENPNVGILELKVSALTRLSQLYIWSSNKFKAEQTLALARIILDSNSILINDKALNTLYRDVSNMLKQESSLN